MTETTRDVVGELIKERHKAGDLIYYGDIEMKMPKGRHGAGAISGALSHLWNEGYLQRTGYKVGHQFEYLVTARMKEWEPKLHEKPVPFTKNRGTRKGRRGNVNKQLMRKTVSGILTQLQDLCARVRLLEKQL